MSLESEDYCVLGIIVISMLTGLFAGYKLCEISTGRLAIQAGLQQCVVEGRTVWQKECK